MKPNFFFGINSMNKTLARLFRKTREKQTAKISNRRDDIIIGSTEIKIK